MRYVKKHPIGYPHTPSRHAMGLALRPSKNAFGAHLHIVVFLRPLVPLPYRRLRVVLVFCCPLPQCLAPKNNPIWALAGEARLSGGQ